MSQLFIECTVLFIYEAWTKLSSRLQLLVARQLFSMRRSRYPRLLPSLAITTSQLPHESLASLYQSLESFSYHRYEGTRPRLGPCISDDGVDLLMNLHFRILEECQQDLCHLSFLAVSKFNTRTRTESQTVPFGHILSFRMIIQPLLCAQPVILSGCRLALTLEVSRHIVLTSLGVRCYT